HVAVVNAIQIKIAFADGLAIAEHASVGGPRPAVLNDLGANIGAVGDALPDDVFTLAELHVLQLQSHENSAGEQHHPVDNKIAPHEWHQQKDGEHSDRRGGAEPSGEAQ